MSAERETQFKQKLKDKEKEKSLPDGILLRIYDIEKEYLRFDETRTEAIKNIQSIINSSLSDDIEKLKEYNKTCSGNTGDHNGS